MGNFRNKMAAFMYGRRGNDELGQFLSLVFLLIIVLQTIFRKSIFYYAGILTFLYQLFRFMSKNISKREAENRKFKDIKDNLFRKRKKKEASPYRYFNCPGCGMKMRAPYGKGRIRVTCKECGKKFETFV